MRDHADLRKKMGDINSDKHFERENAYLAMQELRFRNMEYENQMYEKSQRLLLRATLMMKDLG